MELFFRDFPTWLQGMLFILIAYHATSYFFTKDKSFAIYAAYLFLVIIYLIPKTVNETSNHLTLQYRPFFRSLNWIIQVWYWMLYCYFTVLFLNIKIKNEALANKMINYIIITVLVSTLVFIIDYLLFNIRYMQYYFIYIYTPISLIIVASFLKVIYNFKDSLNKFFVIGSIFFLGFSLLSLYFSYKRLYAFDIIRPIDIFMIGVFLEAIVISIGLGYKFHNYRKERDNYNSLLISELKKNDTLKDQLNEKLSEKIESHKIAEVQALYEKKLNELRLTSLLTQMNPHFIFNALNSIKLHIINHEPKIAAHYLNKFSKLIRRILEASSTTEISLQEELETMELYMTIENIRFSNEIKFSFKVDENINLQTIKVPPLVLQPFLENALWHGLSSKKEDKKIIVSIQKIHQNYIEIIIEDNGIGRKASAKIKSEKTINRKSIGINLTEDRLTNFVKNRKNEYTISYEDLIDKNQTAIGTKVILKIPLL